MSVLTRTAPLPLWLVFSVKILKAKNMPYLKKWSGPFSNLVTEILNLRDCSQLPLESRGSILNVPLPVISRVVSMRPDTVCLFKSKPTASNMSNMLFPFVSIPLIPA